MEQASLALAVVGLTQAIKEALPDKVSGVVTAFLAIVIGLVAGYSGVEGLTPVSGVIAGLSAVGGVTIVSKIAKK